MCRNLLHFCYMKGFCTLKIKIKCICHFSLGHFLFKCSLYPKATSVFSASSISTQSHSIWMPSQFLWCRYRTEDVERFIGLRLPDLANKMISFSVKFKFQINNTLLYEYVPNISRNIIVHMEFKLKCVSCLLRGNPTLTMKGDV